MEYKNAPPSPDVLSSVLSSFKSDRAVTAKFSLHAPWALSSAGVEGPLIRMSPGEPYWLAINGATPVKLEPRDIALLPHGSAHVISSSPELPPTPFKSLIDANMQGKHGDHPIVFSHGAGANSTLMYSLHVWLPATGVGSILQTLPPLIVLRRADLPSVEFLALTTESLVNDSISQQPGWQLSAARMADLLLLHVVREHLIAKSRVQSGLFKGLDDEHIAKAMKLMHTRPQSAWTVESLASECGLSRTVFAERFKSLVGATPMQYLSSFRMTVASEKLKQKNPSIIRVAESVGYESEKSFARAFSKWTGLTPAAFARDHQDKRK